MHKSAFTIFFYFITGCLFSQVNTKHIEIVRGPYGTPHIFASTDKEVAKL